MMVATLKLISTAVCYQDGLVPAEVHFSSACCSLALIHRAGAGGPL